VPAGSFLVRRGTTVDLPTFWIAKYPVTQAQYAAFVQDGGYTERWRHCWSDEGWAEKERWAWHGPLPCGGAYDRSNHPVVGVTWYGAMAFCRWLTERLREVGALPGDGAVSLPTEAQWRKAAQGPQARAYPWGDSPDPNRANVVETGLGTTSAVGCFPGGASLYGVHDLCGNVSEWTASSDREGSLWRVLRGGDHLVGATGAQCGVRLSNLPDLSFDYVGFRCVSPISPSGF
jgi:formylglycine-generating enzyme required for sulfatase activity